MMHNSNGYCCFSRAFPHWLLCLVWITLAPGLCSSLCGIPGKPAFGFAELISSKGSYEVGEEVSYQCSHGYTLFGSKSRQCLSNGSWADVVPVCEQNVALNKVATQLPPANYSFPTKRAVDGDRETYACIARSTPGNRWFKVDLGSTLAVSAVKITVDADRWYRLKIEVADALERTKTICKDVNTHLYETINRFDCGRPIAGSKIIISDTAIATTPAAQTNPNDLLFYEVGVYVDGGETSGCGSPDSPLHGRWVGTYYQCDQGYTLQGGASNRCSKGVWTSPPPFCQFIAQTSSPLMERVQECGTPGVSRRGTTTMRGTTSNSIVRYDCQPGYSLVGDPERKCQPSGSWFPANLPKCVSNVAFSRRVYQSDGNRDSKTVDGNSSICTNIQKGPFPKRWWLVDLGANTFVTNVTIVLQTGVAYSLNVSVGWNVSINNPLNSRTLSPFCHTEGSKATAPLSCRHPLGAEMRFILIEMADTYQSKPVPFILCDVQAFSFLELAQCSKPDEPQYGSAMNVSSSAVEVFRYQCSKGLQMRGSSETRCVNGQWNAAAPVCLGDAPPVHTTSRPVTTTTNRRWPTTDPRSRHTTEVTTPSDNKEKDPYYAGIIGIAVGATVASVSIVLAIVIVVCLLKKHIFKQANYAHSVGFNRENSSTTSNTYGPGSQRSEPDYGPQNHVYDVIKPLEDLLPGRYNGHLTVPNDAYVNNSPSLNANRLNHLQQQQRLPQMEHLRNVPARRQTPLYDMVASEELVPLADEPLPLPPPPPPTLAGMPLPLPPIPREYLDERGASATLRLTPQTTL